MSARRASLDAVQRAALALPYISRRQLFGALARAIIATPPICGGRPASREDIAENLIADIRAILGARSLTGNAAAMCAADPHAEPAQRVYGVERGPHRRRLP